MNRENKVDNLLKVAVDASGLEKDRRGMGFFLREFLSHLSNYQQQHFKFYLTAPKGNTKENFGLEVKRWNELDPSFLVWFPFNHPTFSPPGNYVVTLHDLAAFAFPQGEKKLQEKIMKGAKNSKVVVADSQFTLSEIKKYLNLPNSQLTVIYPGFNPERKENFQGKFDPNFPYLLTVGSAEYRKNFSTLILAFKKLKEKGLQHKLVMIGDIPRWRKKIGPFTFQIKNPILKLIHQLELDTEVLLKGYISKGLLWKWYEKASLFIFPSLYEGFGFPVLEAYSCGTQTALSQESSLPEVGGKAAFYFDPLNPEEIAGAVEKGLSNPVNLPLQKEQLEKFKFNYCLENYLNLFMSLANQ